MIIDFNNRITIQKVEELIEERLSLNTGVINLSTATANEVKDAFSFPEKWLTTINYSGETYMERYRRELNNGNYEIYYYVVGAEADNENSRIYDRILSVLVTPSTGDVEVYTTIKHVPDTIYDLDKMNAEQLKVLRSRAGIIQSANVGQKRFSATWTYNGKRYVYSSGYVNNNNGTLIGTAYDNDEIFFDKITIMSTGTVNHAEYQSNITLTQITQ